MIRALGWVISFVFLSNSLLPISLFVLWLNFTFSRRPRSLFDLSVWFRASHFHFFPPICILAAFTVTLLTRWAPLPASVYCTRFLQRTEQRAGVCARLKKAIPSAATAFTSPQQVFHSFLKPWDRLQNLSLTKKKPLPAGMGREEQEGCFKNAQNAAVIFKVALGWFNFNFLTHVSECVLNTGQRHKRQLSCGLINPFCKEEASRKWCWRKRLESKGWAQGERPIVCCPESGEGSRRKRCALLPTALPARFTHLAKQGPSLLCHRILYK